MNIHRELIDTSRGQLHCRSHGEGPVLLLLQTLPFSAAMFEPLMRELGARFRCHAIDLMGYGESDPRDRMWTVEDYAVNLREACDALKLDSWHVLGGHLTGLVAVELALLEAERTRSVVLDGVYAWTEDEATRYREGLTAPVPWTDEGESLQARWAGTLGLLRKLDPELQLTAATEQQIVRYFFAFQKVLLGPGSSETTFAYRPGARLPLLRAPTLVIGSPTDTLRRFHERAMQWIPGARQHLFDGINPLYQIGRPDRAAEYAAVLISFFARTATAA
jgi:pimeloyl-ACP methyl ester carboxylesterase